jgi:hypothetical protein
MMTNDDKKPQKKTPKYFCQKCAFTTCNKKDYERHISTPKHQNDDKMMTKKPQKTPNLVVSCVLFECECGKQYKYRQGLSIHKKKCVLNKNTNEQMPHQSIINEKDLILTLLNQNNQLQNQIFDLCKDKNNIQIINNTNGSINSNNKTFNLNVFLNEHCKDAMNIMDFVDSLKLQLSDLENVGKLGFIEGISNIIVKNLKALDVHKRPVHCSDSKREVMYVKDENKWEKENDEKLKLRKVIKHIAHKNSKLIPEFRAKYPDCGKSDSKKSDQYNKLVIEAMGGSGDNDDEKADKIIKKIAKEVTIDKTLDLVEANIQI